VRRFGHRRTCENGMPFQNAEPGPRADANLTL
jgi:hypothetical protein